MGPTAVIEGLKDDPRQWPVPISFKRLLYTDEQHVEAFEKLFAAAATP